MEGLHTSRMGTIDDRLVRQLVGSQFPQWADLPVSPVAVGGWDNRSFRLGDKMVVRLPSSVEYAAQVEKEQLWLPKLAPHLPLPIPVPLALGEPTKGYPWRWSIYGWLEGEMAAREHIRDLRELGSDVAHFLAALRRIDASEGPAPGPHNFQRGGPIAAYDAETRGAIEALKGRIDEEAAIGVWEAALATAWQGAPVWVHGDVSAGNLLIREGRLSAVIDFGMLAIGDPACDLSIAWTLLDSQSRSVFRSTLGVDPDTWARGRAWALWKALIVAAGHVETNPIEALRSWPTILEVLSAGTEKSDGAWESSTTPGATSKLRRG